jgi:cell fate (sporulation/competence/biofilm development) regulator YmcA (YheA/YmcA/DUF963 family)
MKYQEARIQALELELKATRIAFAEYNSQISEEAAYDLLDLATKRIKIELNKEEDGETSI